MTQIDFYILSKDSLMARVHYACRLAEKALHRQHQIVLAVADEQAGKELSDYLWQFKPESFIPHQLQSDTTPAPIAIVWDKDNESHHDILINLRADIPEWFSRFQRVMEIVVQEDQCLVDTRQHFQFYRDRGYPLKSHKIAA